MHITSFGINALPTMHRVHFHDEFECHYIINGEGFLFYKNKKSPLKPGNFVMIYPGTGHYLESRESKNSLTQIMWTFEWTGNDNDLKKDLPRYIDSGMVFSIRSQMISYFERMRHLSESPRTLDRKQAQLLLELFLYSIMVDGNLLATQDLDPQVHACIKEMYLRIRSEFSVKDFTEKQGVATSQFIRKFKSIFDKTPYNYYLEIKINALISYLKSYNETLDVAAEKFGFSDRFHLSKVFKKVKKVSPSRYIKK